MRQNGFTQIVVRSLKILWPVFPVEEKRLRGATLSHPKKWEWMRKKSKRSGGQEPRGDANYVAKPGTSKMAILFVQEVPGWKS
jgi:hypothetical protein